MDHGAYRGHRTQRESASPTWVYPQVQTHRRQNHQQVAWVHSFDTSEYVMYGFDMGVVGVEGGRWAYGFDQVCSGDEWDERCPSPSIAALLIAVAAVCLLVDGGDDDDDK